MFCFPPAPGFCRFNELIPQITESIPNYDRAQLRQPSEQRAIVTVFTGSSGFTDVASLATHRAAGCLRDSECVPARGSASQGDGGRGLQGRRCGLKPTAWLPAPRSPLCTLDRLVCRRGPPHPCSVSGKFGPTWTVKSGAGEGGAEVRHSRGPTRQQWGPSPGSWREAGGMMREALAAVSWACLGSRPLVLCPAGLPAASSGSPHLPLYAAVPRGVHPTRPSLTLCLAPPSPPFRARLLIQVL